MRKYLVLITICISGFFSNAQNVGIGVPNPQNKLHVGGGFRLDTLTGVGGAGLVWHNPNGVVYGIKFTGNTNDVLRGDGTFGTYNVNGSIGWLLTGNGGTTPASNFIGTIDDQPLLFRVNNIRHGYLGSSIFFGSGAGRNNTAPTNVGIGNGALGSNTINMGLIAIGDSALFKNSIGSSEYDFGGYNNVGIGYKALYANIDGVHNTAVGHEALRSNTYGSSNTAFGALSLNENNGGSFNSAFGANSLARNIGSNNSAFGYYALWDNKGYANSAFGYGAMIGNTTGNSNVAMGADALSFNLAGFENVAIGNRALLHSNSQRNNAVGYQALFSNNTGGDNCAFGSNALKSNNDTWYNSAFGNNALILSNGYYNSAFGWNAMPQNVNGLGNTSVGMQSLFSNVSGSFNTAIGMTAGGSLPNNVSNVTCIGYTTGWNTTISNQVNIGNFNVSWIGGQTGWFHYSDKRIKNDIKDDVPGLAFITRLRPITYHVDVRKQEEIANSGKIQTNAELIKPTQKDWDGKYDVEKIKMTGFFAQDVEEAANAINYSFNGVHNPKNGGLLSLDYSAFVVPLVKAVQEQQAIIDKQQKQIDDLIKRIEALEKK